MRRLDDLSGGIATPVTVKRGLMARLHYPTKTGHSLAAAKDAGLTVTDRTLQAWLEGKRRPSKTNLERIDAAYRTVHRRNAARHLLARLNRDGRGPRVEIHPLNQSQVARSLRRVVEYPRASGPLTSCPTSVPSGGSTSTSPTSASLRSLTRRGAG